MDTKYKTLLATAALAVGGVFVAATSVAAQGGETETDDNDQDSAEGPDIPITEPDLSRASAAALEFTGEGTVSGTEIEDEESYYEVEVTLDNGNQIDVQLDESFNVVGTD